MPPSKAQSRHGSKAASTAAAIAKLRKQSTDQGLASKAKTARKQSRAMQDRSEFKPPVSKKQSIALPAPDLTAPKAADTDTTVKKSRAKEDISHVTRGFGRSNITTGAVTERSNIATEKTAQVGTKASVGMKEGSQSEANTGAEGTTPGQKQTSRPPLAARKRAPIGTLAVLVLVVGVGAVIAVVIMGTFFVIHRRRVDDVTACRTPQCKAAAEYVHKLLVTGHHPCNHFYSRVCGSLIDQRTGFHEDNVLAAVKTMNASMFVLGETLRSEEIRLGKHILKPLYRKCFRYMSTETDLRKDLAHAKKAMSMEELVQATSFAAIVRYLVRTALRVGLFTLFDVRFVRVGNQSMLQLRRGYSLQGKVGASLEDQDFIFRINKLLSIWLGRENVSTETEMLLRLDREVVKIFSKSAPQVLKPLRNVTSGMMNLTSEQWAAAVNDAHTENQLKLKPSDAVIDTDMASVHNASSFLVGEGVNVTAFYLAKTLAADVVFLVYTKLETASSRLHQAGFCMFLVRKCLSFTWPLLAAEMLLSGTSSVPVLDNLFTGLKETAKGFTILEIHAPESNVLTWIAEESLGLAANVIRNVNLSVVTAALPVGSRANYTGPSPPISDDDQGFIPTYVRARRHHLDGVLRSPPSMAELATFDSEATGRVSFAEVMNSVLVPTVPQLEPYLYERGVPDEYNYGTVGSLLAAGLIEALEASAKGDKSASWDEATRGKRDKTVECLVGRHHRQGFGSKVAGSPKKMRATLMALSAGVRLAYAAMEASFRSRVTDGRHFEELCPAAQETFFVRYCLLWCSASDTPDPIPPKEMCMFPLYNMREFGDRYKCRANTTYSAGALCDV